MNRTQTILKMRVMFALPQSEWSDEEIWTWVQEVVQEMSGGSSLDVKQEEPMTPRPPVVPVNIEERYKLMTLSGELTTALTLLQPLIGPRTNPSSLSQFELEMGIRAATEASSVLEAITHGLRALASSD